MLGLAARLLAGVVTPILDQLSAASSRLVRKIVLFLVAGVCLVVVLIALTVAFDLWIASVAGAIVGALAVAGLYLAVAVIAILFALRKPKPRVAGGSKPRGAAGSQREPSEAEKTAAAAASGMNAQIDAFAAPLLGILQKFGFRKEQLAVLAGTSLAKQIGPVPLVGLAIVAGFLIGRMWGGWRALVSSDTIAALMSSDLLAGFFGGRGRVDPEDEEV